VKQFTTAKVDNSRQLSAWREFMSDVYYSVDVLRDGRHLRGRIDEGEIGNVSITRFDTDAQRVQRTRSCMARSPDDSYVMVFPRRETLFYSQAGAQRVHSSWRLCTGAHERLLRVELPRQLSELDSQDAWLRPARPHTTSDVAERTALPLPTVSRLLATLVREGFLTYNFDAQGYCLGVPLLSLGHAYAEGSTMLRIALPLMTELAHSQRVNVGLGTEDGGDVVYCSQCAATVAALCAGFCRITCPARAHFNRPSLACRGPPAIRQRRLRPIALRYERRWPPVLTAIREGITQVRTLGWCTSRWQTGSVGMARPLGGRVSKQLT
jgi:hypothetical protein